MAPATIEDGARAALQEPGAELAVQQVALRRVLQPPAVGEPQVDLTAPTRWTAQARVAMRLAGGRRCRRPVSRSVRVSGRRRTSPLQRHPCRTDPGAGLRPGSSTPPNGTGEVGHLTSQDRLVLAECPRQVEALDLQPEPLHEEARRCPPLSHGRPRPAGGPGRVGAARCRPRATASLRRVSRRHVESPSHAGERARARPGRRRASAPRVPTCRPAGGEPSGHDAYSSDTSCSRRVRYRRSGSVADQSSASR